MGHESQDEAVQAGRPLLEFTDVAKSYGADNTLVHALKSTTFSLEAGELVAVMGPSGSGKSTMLALAGGMERPTSGVVRIAGRDLAECSSKDMARLRRRILGYVFQELNLMPGLTARENVALPLELDGWSVKKIDREVGSALERVGIQNLSGRFPDQLSGGEQQRVAIARAFVGSRELVLADEPTGALDTANGETVMELLREQCDSGKSALLVTHNPTHAAWADRVIFIKDGCIVDESRPQSPAHEIPES
ncbi:MAG: ABC transporter ATP-binding protein [Planctomycetota bacterium]